VVHSVYGQMRGYAGKTVGSLDNACLSWALIKSNKHYIKCPHLYLLGLPFRPTIFRGSAFAVWQRIERNLRTPLTECNAFAGVATRSVSVSTFQWGIKYLIAFAGWRHSRVSFAGDSLTISLRDAFVKLGLVAATLIYYRRIGRKLVNLNFYAITPWLLGKGSAKVDIPACKQIHYYINTSTRARGPQSPKKMCNAHC